MAHHETERRQVLCQAISLGQNFNEAEIQRKMTFIQNLKFQGYLQIENFTIMEKILFVFFTLEGQVESIFSLLGRQYTLSNFEIARLGILILDSYALFAQAAISHQDIE